MLKLHIAMAWSLFAVSCFAEKVIDDTFVRTLIKETQLREFAAREGAKLSDDGSYYESEKLSFRKLTLHLTVLLKRDQPDVWVLYTEGSEDIKLVESVRSELSTIIDQQFGPHVKRDDEPYAGDPPTSVVQHLSIWKIGEEYVILTFENRTNYGWFSLDRTHQSNVVETSVVEAAFPEHVKWWKAVDQEWEAKAAASKLDNNVPKTAPKAKPETSGFR